MRQVLAARSSAFFPARQVFERWQESEIDIHRLEMCRVTGRNIMRERAVTRCLRKYDRCPIRRDACGIDPRRKAGSRRLDIPLDARHLSGEE